MVCLSVYLLDEPVPWFNSAGLATSEARVQARAGLATPGQSALASSRSLQL